MFIVYSFAYLIEWYLPLELGSVSICGLKFYTVCFTASTCRTVPGCFGWRFQTHIFKIVETQVLLHFLIFQTRTNQNELCKKILHELVPDSRRNQANGHGAQFLTMALAERKITLIISIQITFLHTLYFIYYVINN